MLVFDSLRGEDSTGVADINLEGRVNIVKELGPPQMLWSWGDPTVFDHKGMQQGATKALIGHNRAATQGKVTAENAHPFEFDGLVGAHNGTLDDWTIRDFEEYKNHDVDSHVLFDVMNNKGVDEMYKNISGAMALTWYNKETEELHFLRNSQRPLFYAYDKAGTAIIWSSEQVFLVGAAIRAGLDLHEDGVQSVPVDTLLTFVPKVNSCVKSEDRDLEKKTHGVGYGTRNAGKNGIWGDKTKVSVGTTQTKGSSWKKGTRKVDKKMSKNIQLRLGHMSFMLGKAMCVAKMIDTDTTVNIHFSSGKNNEFNIEDTKAYMNDIRDGNRLYETTCRMRVSSNDNKDTYHIFHSGVKPVRKSTVIITPHTPLPPNETSRVIQRAKVESNVIPMLTKVAYRGERISEQFFDRKTHPYKDCCPACGNPVSWDTMDDLVWLSCVKYMCKECNEDSFKVQQVMIL